MLQPLLVAVCDKCRKLQPGEEKGRKEDEKTGE